MATRPAAPDTLRRPHRSGFGALALVVLGLHVGALTELGREGRPGLQTDRGVARPARAALQTRIVPLTVPAQAPKPQAPSRPARPQVESARPPSEPAAGVAQPATPEALVEGPADALPVYAFRLPAADTLRFEVRRGASTGSAQLHWQPDAMDAGGYRVTLDIDGPAGRGRRTLQSDGTVDFAGLAPRRFTDRRRPGATQAANFQREAGKISYSGPAAEFPLSTGAQDRASWIIQLAAVVEADAALRQPGAEVVLFVTGAQGDAGWWRFEVVGRELLDLPEGVAIESLRLRRTADRPWGLGVDVWLDPLRGHLPARLRLATVERGEVLDLWRR